jgi:predicted nuclease of predicted toxin-antitoxin system
MKLLFDQNLSPRLVKLLDALFPGSTHLDPIGLGEAPDAVVWEFAEDNGFIITSKDSDYLDCLAAFGFPPHVISIRSGNCSTSHVEKLLRTHFDSIQQMVSEDQIGFIALM